MGRIAPDNNDIVVWKFDDASAPFVNSSTSTNSLGSAANLNTLSGLVLLQQPSLFSASGTNSCVAFTANNSNGPRNYISGANTVEPQAPVTISFWIYLRAYNSTGFTQHPVTKQHTAGAWSGSSFAQAGLQSRTYTGQPSSFDLFFATSTGGGITITPDMNIPLNCWSHIGLTYDGSVQTGYINGNFVGQNPSTGPIAYGGHGPWFFGAIPAGSGNPEESANSLCDLRIANIVRPLSYFQNVYRSGQLNFGTKVTTYYKLRAYDTGCSTTSPVYWVSTSPDFSAAPSPPCGGPYSTLDILNSWEVVG